MLIVQDVITTIPDSSKYEIEWDVELEISDYVRNNSVGITGATEMAQEVMAKHDIKKLEITFIFEDTSTEYKIIKLTNKNK